jgi:serine/threonine protein kinase
VQETTSGGRIYWPSPQEYCEAVQTPRLSFEDEELCNGSVKTSPLGLPICMSGNFASVFCFDCGGKKVAVRCFLHNIPDQNQRYSEISKFVLSDNLECTVPFEYLEHGIKIHGDWYPILKMEWVDGITLNQFVDDHLQNSMAMNLLAGYFKDMVIDLQKAGIAHGDLQHDNILISDDSLRLVDYDGLFVPALAGCYANELGHPNYQHPGRTKENFSADLDNFSAWVIYLSLRILSLHPDLLQQVQGGGDCLLLRQTDLQKPNQSIAFKLLEHHADERVRSYAQILLYFLNLPFADIPPLNTPIKQLVSAASHVAEQRQAIHFNRTHVKRVNDTDCAASADLANSSGLPDWMHDSLSPSAERRKAREFEQPTPPPPLQALAKAIAGKTAPTAQSLYANSPLLVPSQSASGATLHSPLLQPLATANTQTRDDLYPEFLKVEMPFDAPFKFHDANDVEDFVVPQLEPGEKVLWRTHAQSARRGLSATSFFWICAICVSLFVSLAVSPAIFSIAVASFVLMYMCGLYHMPRPEQVLALVTDRRLIQVTKFGQGAYCRYTARSVPLSEVAWLDFTEPDRLTFAAVNDFRLAYFRYASKLNITASRADAQVLLKMQPHRAVQASKAYAPSKHGTYPASVGQVLSAFSQPVWSPGSSQTSAAVSGANPPPLSLTANQSRTHIGVVSHPNLQQTHVAAGQSYTASGHLSNAQNPHLHYPNSTPQPVKTSLLPPITAGSKPGSPEENVSIDDLAKLLGLAASPILSLSTVTGSSNSVATSPGKATASVTSASSNNGSAAAASGAVVISTTGGAKTSSLSSSPVLSLTNPNDPDDGAYISIKEAAQMLGKKRSAP